MIGEEFVSRKPVTLVEVKAILKERKREDKEPTYEQDQANKYVGNFAKLTDKQREKVFEELKALESLDEKSIVKIMDVMPSEIEIMKISVEKKEGLKEEDLVKALEIIKKYVAK
ncbi:MAG: DNA-directed RNA polymerase subunit F [Candidatus Diapherotrites archaeon]|nr:DNA-directed RNA polymerase subunit F [Candidatus Diapherotrites archaeon]